MADSIIRLKVDSQEYEGKIKRAAQGLQALGQNLRSAGKTFADADKDAVKFAKELGNMQTVSNTARGKISELSAAFVNLKSDYLNMTDAEKQSPIGQAMAKSLEQLKTRIIDTKEQLSDIQNSLNNGIGNKVGGGLFGEGGLTGMLQVFGGNMLTKGFEMLAGGLTESWSKSIELARAGEGVRLAFERLNQPGLLDKLKEATHGTVSEVELMKQAIKFENFKLPLEDLATYLAFAQQKAKDTGESVDYMVNSITTGLGRQSKQILDNLGISAAELTRRMNEGADMTKAVADIIREEMAKAGDYVETAADKAAQAAAKATDELEKFGQSAAPIAEEWSKTWNAISIGAMDLANIILGPLADSIRTLQNIWNNGWEDNIINSPYNLENGNYRPPKTGYQGMGDKQKVTAPGGYIEVTDPNTGAVIGGQHFDNLNDKNAIKDWQKSLFKNKKQGTKTTAKVPTWDDFAKQNIHTNQYLEQNLGKALPEKVMPSVFALLSQNDKGFRDLLGISAKQWDYKKDITEKDYRKLPGYKKDEGSDLDKFNKDFSKVTSGVGSIVSGIQSMGVEIPKEIQDVLGILQGISTIMSGMSILLSLIQVDTKVTAAATTADAAIPFFARGGVVPHAAGGYMVPGTHYSGDVTPILANAGEVVLNRAQTAGLAQELEGVGSRQVTVHGVLRGKDIFIAAENWSRSAGRGEFVTW